MARHYSEIEIAVRKDLQLMLESFNYANKVFKLYLSNDDETFDLCRHDGSRWRQIGTFDKITAALNTIHGEAKPYGE